MNEIKYRTTTKMLLAIPSSFPFQRTRTISSTSPSPFSITFSTSMSLRIHSFPSGGGPKLVYRPICVLHFGAICGKTEGLAENTFSQFAVAKCEDHSRYDRSFYRPISIMTLWSSLYSHSISHRQFAIAISPSGQMTRL